MEVFALAFGDVELRSTGRFQTPRPEGELSADIANVGLEPTQASNSRDRIVQQQFPQAFAITDVGGAHHDRQHPSEGIEQEMLSTSVDVLTLGPNSLLDLDLVLHHCVRARAIDETRQGPGA